MLPKIELKLYDKVYYPSKTNDILEVTNFLETTPFPVILNSHIGTFSINGLYSLSDLNPTIFPATLEWYNILKNVYPNLQPPKQTIRVVLTKTVTQYYSIDIEENSPKIATEIAIDMLNDSSDGFELMAKNISICSRSWKKL